jgi:hypothetical protein
MIDINGILIGEINVLKGKGTSVPLFPSQIPHGLPWD